MKKNEADLAKAVRTYMRLRRALLRAFAGGEGKINNEITRDELGRRGQRILLHAARLGWVVLDEDDGHHEHGVPNPL